MFPMYDCVLFAKCIKCIMYQYVFCGNGALDKVENGGGGGLFCG